MRNSGYVYLFLIFCMFLGFIICAGCTQKDGASPLVSPGQTPSILGGPSQPDPGAPAGTCPEPQIWCNGRCVDPATDMGNCGGCMNPCQPGQPCIGGKCGSENPGMPGTPSIPEIPETPVIPGTPAVFGTPMTSGIPGSPSCTSGQTNCYGSCVDLQSDATHCGACNIKCPSGKVCSAGSCMISCSAGQNNCGGSCINTQTSSQHCGKCNNPCSSGQTCQNSKCGLYASVMTLDPHVICINSGKSWCWGSCADIQTDSINCGSCGTKCPAGSLCSGGKCMDWTGTWTTSPSVGFPLKLVQAGSSVTASVNLGFGTYTLSGTSAGTPPKLTGTWVTSSDKGTLEFDMSVDGKQFMGWISTDGTPGKKSITGTRT